MRICPLSPQSTLPFKPLIVIPARMASTRLPGKPLADIGGMPMIVHVWRRACDAQLGPVVVACAEPDIARVIEQHGGIAVLTDPDLPSGSDRVWRAVQQFDPHAEYTHILNVQGDLPTLAPHVIADTLRPLHNDAVDIATLAAEIQDEADCHNPNVVKVVTGLEPTPGSIARALYFTRSPAPHGPGPFWHHIGLYAYRRSALETFVALPPSPLEQREKLEQLRALEHNMRIDCLHVTTTPLGVDTPEDLEHARALLSQVS